MYFTVTTLDTDLWKRLEPGTPPPGRRLETMAILAEAGITTGVLMAPVLPGITDCAEAVNAVAGAAVQHGATSFTALPLRLAPLVREHFLNFIASDFPNLFSTYARMFRIEHPPDGWKSKVADLSAQASVRHGIGRREERQSVTPAPAMALTSQLALF